MNSFSIKQHCKNCGKFGHNNKNCKDPITSIGILCIKVDKSDDLIAKIRDLTNPVNILKYNTQNNKILAHLESYNDKCFFLMIKRKHSLGFLEFIRGRYDITDYQKIIKFFEYMTEEEIDKVKDMDFDIMWKEVWGETAYLKVYEEEYIKSKEKFNILKSENEKYNVLGLKFFTDNIQAKWKHGEWGFPKGRRSFHETNLECAVREFQEETGYTEDDYEILHNVLPIKEIFNGTNGVLYKHVYYVAVFKNDKPPEIHEDNKEVGEIDWYNYTTSQELIRDYHTEKKKILNEIFKFVVSVDSSNQTIQEN